MDMAFVVVVQAGNDYGVRSRELGASGWRCCPGTVQSSVPDVLEEKDPSKDLLCRA